VKRRCLYHWIDYPSAVAELEIVRRKIPGLDERLSSHIVAFVQKLRAADLFKRPGIAETLDWARALIELDQRSLEANVVNDTLGVLLKYQDDIAAVRGSEASKILDEVLAGLSSG
jgi:MoxR-like ATPase